MPRRRSKPESATSPDPESTPDASASPNPDEQQCNALEPCKEAEIRELCKFVSNTIRASEERLVSVVKRLPGWTEGSSIPAVLIDFLSSEYHWILEVIAGLDNRQMISFIEQALRRKAAEAGRNQSADPEKWLPAREAV